MKKKLQSIIHTLEDHVRSERNKGINFILNFDDKKEGACKTDPITPSKNESSNIIEETQNKVLVCTKCSLFDTRKNTVFGEGSLTADLVFVGEAPGADEDETGRPFVGKAGRLLTEMIEKSRSLGLKRSDVYICNILKCRPPGNRNPLPTEILECREYLMKQLNFIKPKIICTLGSIATQALLDTKQGITKLRGQFYDFNGTLLIPTFHPAYLIRNASKKKEAWEDMLLIKEKLNER
ncbi:MAG: uracil-DNA glycosylase [Candidatus Aureabacteria bacterium]|nr:uracil-DNA glycosylase [Candidatus Paceibacterota bacterium]MCK5706390.1 uracil-DNA glycosylase [Candidatus Auribacterota bacterium]